MGEPSRSERIRRQQRSGPPPSPEDAYRALLAMIAPHLDCQLTQAGRCVWCRTRGTRLWQGKPFTDAEKAELRAECERMGVPAGEQAASGPGRGRRDGA